MTDEVNPQINYDDMNFDAPVAAQSYVPDVQTQTAAFAPTQTLDPMQAALANQQSASPYVTGDAPVSPNLYGGEANGMSRNNVAQTLESLVKSGDTGGPKDLIQRLQDGIKNNPLLALMAFQGVGGAMKNEQAKQAAAQAQADRLATLDHEAQIARDRIAANSASVTGIRPTQGIIAQELKRLNGQPVFQPNGRVVV